VHKGVWNSISTYLKLSASFATVFFTIEVLFTNRFKINLAVVYFNDISTYYTNYSIIQKFITFFSPKIYMNVMT